MQPEAQTDTATRPPPPFVTEPASYSAVPETPPPAPREPAAQPDRDRQRAHAAVRVAQALTRVVGMRLIYERDNEVLEQATTHLIEVVTEHVGRYGSVRWRIEPKAIRADGDGAPADAAAETPLAARLYREGVRALVLESGIEASEIVGLGEVLAGALRYGGQSDDLVTVLWKRDFRHVDYFLLDHSDLVDLDSSQDEPQSRIGGRGRELFRQVYTEVWRAVSMADWEAEPSDHVMDLEPRVDPRQAPPPEEEDAPGVTAKSDPERFLETDGVPVGDVYQQRDLEALFGVGAAEVERLQKEMRELTFVRCLARASDLALDLIRGGVIDIAPQSLAALYVDAIREHACRGHLEDALAILTRLSELSRDPATPAKARESLGEVQTCLARPERLEPFCDALVRAPTPSIRVLLAYLDLLGPAGLAGAEHVLGVVEAPQIRARLVKFLAERALDGRFPLDTVLLSAHADVIEGVLRELRQRNGNSIECLEPLCGHPSAAVRLYVVQCVATVRGEKSAALCARLLDDAESEVRVGALTALALLENKGTFRRLLPRAQDPSLLKLPLEEQDALFRALMASDPSRAVRVLERLALRRGWPWNRAQERMRELAACALARAGTHRVRTFLKRGRKSRDLALRKACEQAWSLVPPCTLAGRLGAALVTDGCLTDDGLSEALHHQKRYGGKLGEIVVQNGLADERAVLRVMAQRLGLIGCLTAADLDQAVIESAAFHLVPVEIAKRYRVVPVHYAEAGDQLFLATANPADANRLEAARREIHVREVVPLIALRPTIEAGIVQFYGGKWGALRSAAKVWLHLRQAARRGGPGLGTGLLRLLRGKRAAPPVRAGAVRGAA